MNTLAGILSGASVIVGTLVINPQQLINEAIAVVSVANTHQLGTALELYYSDNDHYPLAINGPELFQALKPYLRNQPLNENAYIYSAKDNGQNYTLTLDPILANQANLDQLNTNIDQILVNQNTIDSQYTE